MELIDVSILKVAFLQIEVGSCRMLILLVYQTGTLWTTAQQARVLSCKEM